MRWQISGARADSGDEVNLAVEASDQAEAEHIARNKGLLVSSIRPLDGPAAREELSAGGGAAPEYAGIVSGARWLRVLASCAEIVGAIYVVFGILVPLWMVVFPDPDPKSALDLAGALIIIVFAVISGVMFLGTAVVLRMLAELGVAHRDLVRNSFKTFK